MKTIFALILSFLLINNLEAKLALHLSVIYKKGIGKGFFLSNEKHTIEQVDEKELVSVVMKSGHKVELYGIFISSLSEYGPSGFVRIKGNIINPDGKTVKTLNEPPLDIYLGHSKTVIYTDKSGEEIELRVAPHPF